MTAWMIVTARIHDREKFITGYGPAAAKLIGQFGGKYIVRAPGAEILEGEGWAGASVVISEWPDKAAGLLPVADLRIERVVETGLLAPVWTLEQSGLRAGASGRVFVSAKGHLTLLTEPALDNGVAIQTGAMGQVSLSASGDIRQPTPGPSDVPLVDTRTLSLKANSIAAMSVAVDELSASAINGGLSFTDVDRQVETQPGLTLKDIATTGNVVITAQSDLSVEKIRTGSQANVSLMSLAGDLLMAVADALSQNLNELSLVAAGFVSSPRLFTGATRTEYRSGTALRLGTAVGQLPLGTAVLEPTDLSASPAVQGLSVALPTQALVLRTAALRAASPSSPAFRTYLSSAGDFTTRIMFTRSLASESLQKPSSAASLQSP